MTENTFSADLNTDVQAAAPIPDNMFAETVTEVEHYTDHLFRFRITRPASFRFRSGEFVMIGLPESATGEKSVFRAYSIASPSWDETLEFFSIKVPGGPLTEHLQNIVAGDVILMRKKSTGTLVLDALLPGKRLWMISTGTGFAPFASLIRDPEAYEKFDTLFATHTCRYADELSYSQNTVAVTQADPLVGELAASRLQLITTTTRDDHPLTGRITTLMQDGSLCQHLGISGLDPEYDRVMICGSMAMLKDVRTLVEKAGFVEGANNKPGSFVVERAFVG
jgi:ferredoxin--NADP+ reductase